MGSKSVFDNSSTDGTYEYINSNFEIKDKEKFTWKKMSSNQGGAGGFYAGVKEFITLNEWEYCWLMDDDGLPEDTCLEHLLKYSNSDKFIGPVVVDPRDKTSVSFPFRCPQTREICRTLNDLSILNRDILNGVILPFNGVLLSKKIIKKVGLPKKEFFIWGDEIEYLNRIKRAGFEITMILTAKFYHPKGKNIGRKTFFGRYTYNDTDSAVKLYCYCRNNISILKHYRSFGYAMAFTGLSFWFYLFTVPSFTKLRIVFKASLHGWSNNFSCHNQYIE